MGADRSMAGLQKQRSPFAGAYTWFPKGVRPAALHSGNAGSIPARRSNDCFRLPPGAAAEGGAVRGEVRPGGAELWRFSCGRFTE